MFFSWGPSREIFGYTKGAWLYFNDYLFEFKLKRTNNKIGFLATASKDDEKKINLFYKRFENKKTNPSFSKNIPTFIM